MVIAAVHVYLAFGHLSELFGGDIQWTHIWKGFGALGGAYVFAALASRGPAPEKAGRTTIGMKNEWNVIFPFENTGACRDEQIGSLHM